MKQTATTEIPPLGLKMPKAAEILNQPGPRPVLADENPFEASLKARRAVGQVWEYKDKAKNQDGVYCEVLNAIYSTPGDQEFGNRSGAVEKPAVEKLAATWITFSIRIAVDGTTRNVQKVTQRNAGGVQYVPSDSFFEAMEVSHEGNALLKESQETRLVGPGSQVY